MSFKKIIQLSFITLLAVAGQAYAGCQANANPDKQGVCQCENGFVMNTDGQCRMMHASEANVLP